MTLQAEEHFKITAGANQKEEKLKKDLDALKADLAVQIDHLKKERATVAELRTEVRLSLSLSLSLFSVCLETNL